MVLTLYQIPASPPVRAVEMVIHALGIPDVENVLVNLLEGAQMKEEYLKLNPQHTVPMLKDDDFVIWDSHAITTYLIAKYAKDDSLYPSDPKKRAVIDQRLHFDSGVLFPACRESLVPVLQRGEKTIRPEMLAKIKAGYEFLEQFLSSGPWLAGDSATLADICCVATVSTLNEIFPINVDLYPKIIEWVKRCESQDFYSVNKAGLLQFRQLLQSKLN